MSIFWFIFNKHILYFSSNSSNYAFVIESEIKVEQKKMNEIDVKDIVYICYIKTH